VLTKTSATSSFYFLFITMMDMSSARKYSVERQSGGSPRNSSYNRTGHQSPHIPPVEPSLRQLSRRKSDEGLLPPPLPRVHHNRSNDSVSSNHSTPSRRLCAKCGLPMQDKFVRAMGKKFHLDCFRCQVFPLLDDVNGRCVIRRSLRNSFLSMTRKRVQSTHCVRRITFDGWICYVRIVGRP
jgi:hypothetical protein